MRVVNQTLTALGLEKAPNKTFIGRVEKGFDFLGYHVSPQGLTVAAQTWMNFLEYRRRLYEQAAYERRWLAWSRVGLCVWVWNTSCQWLLVAVRRIAVRRLARRSVRGVLP